MDIIRKQPNTRRVAKSTRQPAKQTIRQSTPRPRQPVKVANSQQYNNTRKSTANSAKSEQSALHSRKSIKSDNKYLRSNKAIAKKRKKTSTSKKKKFFKFSLFFFIIAILFAGGFFVYQTNTTINQITDGDEKHSFVKTVSSLTKPLSYKSLDGFKDGRINILLLGRANTHKKGGDLTDTIMIASVNTNDYTVGLFSIPRDFLVSNGSFYSKINSRYQIGLRNDEGAKYIISSVEKITDQDIHYYFVLDFEGFEKIIDTLDGINIDVPKHIKDERYPGPGYSYETFEVYPGLQEFDGTTALKYARTRHADIEGDFGRAKRQQQVMQAARNKAFSLGTIVNPIKMTELLNVLGEHIHTDISPYEIEPFISLIKKLDTHNINNVVLDAWKPGSLLISARYYNAQGGISGLVPRSGTYTEIQEQIENLFDLDKIKQRQEEIKNESPTVVLINTTENIKISTRVKKTLSSLGFKNITIQNDDFNTQNQTTVIDNAKGTKTFSLDELIKKLPATVDTNHDLSSQEYKDTDFVILLGSDIVDAYTYTEISQEELESENAKNNDK